MMKVNGIYVAIYTHYDRDWFLGVSSCLYLRWRYRCNMWWVLSQVLHNYNIILISIIITNHIMVSYWYLWKLKHRTQRPSTKVYQNCARLVLIHFFFFFIVTTLISVSAMRITGDVIIHKNDPSIKGFFPKIHIGTAAKLLTRRSWRDWSNNNWHSSIYSDNGWLY